MKKFTLSIILALSSFALSAQSACTCLPEGITFSTQADINNFTTNYPGCVKIEGDVLISGQYITNLNGLSVLTSIGGELFIGDDWPGSSSLTSLAGLENLTSIGGNLHLYRNYALTNLSGLENLNSIGGDLVIHINILTSISGLENVSSIGGVFI